MDARYETFLTLYKLMNYRKTAEAMHLTQPAVTRQIQSLEAEFGTRLFLYDRHKLSRTPAADVLGDYIISLRQNYAHLQKDMRSETRRTIRVGATKTIGDYVIPEAVQHYLSDESHNLSLEINNTEILLQKLKESELDFAIVEGIFDKNRYASRLLKLEEFTGICKKDHRFAGQVVSLEEVFAENLIVREKGSGTRNLLERELFKNGYRVEQFRRCTEISSFQVITRLVSEGTAVSFVYRAVVEKRPDIATFQVSGFERLHEFNVVWLKHTVIPKAGERFLQTVWRESGQNMLSSPELPKSAGS